MQYGDVTCVENVLSYFQILLHCFFFIVNDVK